MPDADNKSIDLSDALKNRRTRATSENQQTEEDASIDKSPKMVRWVIVHSGGFIKTSVQAHYILIAFSTVALILSFYIFFGMGNEQSIIIRPAI